MTAGVLSAVCAAVAVVLVTPSPSRLHVLRDRSPAAPAPSGLREWVLRRWRREDQLDLAISVADRWVAQLVAGRPPTDALIDALDGASSSLVRPARQLSLGAEPAQVLAHLGGSRGSEGFAALSACWQVTAGVGGPLAETVRRCADGLRAERIVHAEIATQLAAPKATATMVALLPLSGPLLGLLIGADSVHVLLATPTGRSLLVAGLVFDAVGIWWVARLIRSARRAS